MRRPGSRSLNARVTLQHAQPGSDPDGGLTQTPVTYQTDVPCAVGPGKPERDVEDFRRFTGLTEYELLFDDDPGLGLGDFILWPEDPDDIDSKVHNLVVKGVANQAGRGVAWLVTATERV